MMDINNGKRNKRFAKDVDDNLEKVGKRAGKLQSAENAKEQRKQLSKLVKYGAEMLRTAIENLSDSETAKGAELVRSVFDNTPDVPTKTPEEFVAFMGRFAVTLLDKGVIDVN